MMLNTLNKNSNDIVPDRNNPKPLGFKQYDFSQNSSPYQGEGDIQQLGQQFLQRLQNKGEHPEIQSDQITSDLKQKSQDFINKFAKLNESRKVASVAEDGSRGRSMSRGHDRSSDRSRSFGNKGGTNLLNKYLSMVSSKK